MLMKIIQTVEAASGVVAFSRDRNNKVILKSTDNKPISSLSHLGKAKVEFVVNSKAILENICTEKFIPMFKALYLRKNGKFELAG
jgi:hypothetical protein